MDILDAKIAIDTEHRELYGRGYSKQILTWANIDFKRF